MSFFSKRFFPSRFFGGRYFGAPVGTPAVNAPPALITPIPNQSATEGVAFSYTFPEGTFTDADSDALTYTAFQTDSSALPAWLTFDGPTRTFQGTPGAGDVGTLSIRVVASDGDATASDDFSISVATAAGFIFPGSIVWSLPQGDQSIRGDRTYPMHPQDVRFATVLWDEQLAPGDTIATAVVAEASGDGQIVLGAPVVNGTAIVARGELRPAGMAVGFTVSGGTDNQKYDIRVTVNTTNGEVMNALVTVGVDATT